jgi:DNA-binding CsgD family transcriptional regulator
MTEQSPITELSERELEILRLVATGASNKEIAYQLSISANTVKVHLRNIFGKIGVASRTEAAMYAVKRGVVVGDGISVTSVQSVAEGDSPHDFKEKSPLRPKYIDRARFWAGMFVFVCVGILIVVIIALVWQRFRPMTLTAADEPVFTTSADAELARWQKLADMPFARAGFAAVAYENHIYVIGGKGAVGVTGAMEAYDPATNQWQVDLPSKPTPVMDFGAVVLGGKIYVPGGMMASGAVTNVFEVYDPRVNQWTQASPLPFGLSAYAIVAFEGRCYVFGGWDGFSYLDTVIMYRPDQNTWELKSAMPVARGFAGAAVARGKIYLLGGKSDDQTLSSTMVYQAELDGSTLPSWGTVASLPNSQNGMAVTSVADIIHSFGGQAGDGQQLLKYLIPNDEWQAFSIPARHTGIWIGAQAVAYGSDIYVMGGLHDGNLLDDIYAYKAIYDVAIPVIR